MAASGAKVGFGTTLTLASTAITEITDISGPGMSRTMIDVTNMLSDNNAKEFIGGLLDGGEIKFSASVIAAKVTALYALYALAAASSYTLTLSNTLGAWTGSAWLQNLEIKAPLDDKIGIEVTLRTTGKPTYT